jgi:hypothetical protein
MILVLEFIILCLLLVILLQDLWYRSVNWVVFPLLTAALFDIQLLNGKGPVEILVKAVPGACFLILVFVLLTLYFSWKKGKIILLTNDWIGLADILLLIAIAFYLPLLNYIVFYIISLLFTILSWIIYQIISPNKSKHIPLAGFQSLLFVVFLASDWWYFHLNLNDDYWLYSHIIPWIQNKR